MTSYVTNFVLLHEKVKSELSRRIAQGKVKCDECLGSERDIGEQLGVSRITVRKALADMEEEGLIYRVAGKGTFVRSNEKKSTTHLLAVLSYFDFAIDAFYAAVFAGIQDEAQRFGYHLIANKLNPDSYSEDMIKQFMKRHPVDGCLLVGGIVEGIIRLVEQDKKPMILVDHSIKDSSRPAVMGDNESGAWTVTQHLLERGHRKIAHLTRPVIAPSFSLRQTGWEKALREAGLAPSSELLWQWSQDQDPKMHAICQKLCHHPPTAIFCANDAIALRLLYTLAELKINVPDDISVVGFDDIPLAESASLTTMAVPKQDLGAIAVKRLINQMNGTDFAPPTVILPLKLIVRQSSAPPKTTRKHITGFTLTELLVVISVLMAMAALLSPALKKARDSGRGIQCMNNLKQIGLIATFYCQDNDGWFPTSVNWYWGGGYGKGWAYEVDRKGYIKDRRILACPSLVGKYPYSAGLPGCTYTLNTNLCPRLDASGQIYDGGSWSKIEMVRNPAGCYLAVEILDGVTWGGTPFNPCITHWDDSPGILEPSYCQHPTFPDNMKAHNNGWNYLFVDGHVEWAQQAKPRNPFWMP